MTCFAVRPTGGSSPRSIDSFRLAISSFTTVACRVLPAFFFQITKPQPGSSFDQHEKPLRFSITSLPQTGHGPRLARSIFTPFSLSSSCTVDSVNFAMSFMNDGRLSSPSAISSSRFSHSPVSCGEVSGCSPSRRITCTPFSVACSARPSRSM